MHTRIRISIPEHNERRGINLWSIRGPLCGVTMRGIMLAPPGAGYQARDCELQAGTFLELVLAYPTAAGRRDPASIILRRIDLMGTWQDEAPDWIEWGSAGVA